MSITLTTEALEAIEVVAAHLGCQPTAEAVFSQARTCFVEPPIPTRSCYWAAYFNGEEEGPVGRGATEAEAITDLVLTAEMEWS